MNHSVVRKSHIAAKPSAIAMILAIALMIAPAAVAQNAGGNNAFAFNSNEISGFNSGKVLLTGGGAVNLNTKEAHAGGSFTCLEGVNQGPLTGCKAGEGVRWDTAGVLTSVGFKCTGTVDEIKKTAITSTSTTNPDTVVLLADFYRNGDGNDESFTAQMIVSTHDLAPEIPGIQNVWIEKVGCGSAIVTFNQ